jgi:hypothetical protein
MKKFAIAFAVCAAVVLTVAGSFAADEKPWFDMEHCDFCKNLLTEPHLFENMTWEHHDISNGLLTLTVVKPEYETAYLNAMHAMEEVGTRLAQGDSTVHLCNHCRFFSMTMTAGAKMEHIRTCAGDITLLTSDKPEVLAMIRDYADKTRDALAEGLPSDIEAE